MDETLSRRPRGRRSAAAVGLLFGLSGAPALIEQVAWERILALHSGVGAVSVTLIVCAFMAGLGIGGQIGGRLSRRLSPRGALWAFAAVELALGVFSWFSGPFYHRLPGIDPSWFRGEPWRMGLAHLAVLLPPTILMGTTLPLLVRALVHDAPEAARRIGLLYGLNVVGAAVGALAAPWWLIPNLGLVGALRLGAACRVLGALGVVAIGGPATEEKVDDEATNLPPETAAESRFGLWAFLCFLSGFYAIALEVVWFRIIDVGVKGTAYTFGTVLAIYLAGLAAGSLIGSRLAKQWRDPLGVFLACQCGVLLYAGLSIATLVRLSPDVLGWYFQYWGSYEPLTPRWEDLEASLSLYAVFPILLFGPPTLLMGLAFTALQRGVQDEAQTSGYKVGVLQSANIAGCVAGGLVVGLWLFVALGTESTLRLMVASGALPAAIGLAHAVTTRRDVRPAGVLLAALLAVAAAMPGREALWLRLHGAANARTMIAEGPAGVAALAPDSEDRWRMSVNGKGQSFLPFGGVHSKLGALPATLHPAPERVAVIGLGSGDTAWAAGCRRETQSLSVFEVIAGERVLLKRLDETSDLPRLSAFLNDPRIAVIEADGRTALEGGDVRYDLIEADAIRPNGAYSGNLYSIEFFKICLSRLAPGGLMCSWSPTPRTRDTFRRVFPYVLEVDGVILIGSDAPIKLDLDDWRRRLESPEVAAYLGPQVLGDCLRTLPSAHLLDPAVDDHSEDVNTDLFPRDEYDAPRAAPTTSPRG
ncbi:fused MFS/spermidine synthase [Paludisphaera rhizosphaerae]|uniref:fused MFS/spermidine synthase n=1 Tax=Paludisphaera rhizosphaerae TaxID=2711216 RepID=UPI0013ECCE98|nr:fused MFS/spermidine synthase [Paludisphaera rhizosphaerae]